MIRPIILLTLCLIISKKVISQEFFDEGSLFINNYINYISKNRIKQIDLETEKIDNKKKVTEIQTFFFNKKGFYIGNMERYISSEVFNVKQTNDTFRFNAGCHGYYDCSCFDSSFKLECNNDGKMVFYKDYMGIQKVVYDSTKRLDSVYRRFFITERPDSFSLSKFCYIGKNKTSIILTFIKKGNSAITNDTMNYFKDILFDLKDEKKIEYSANDKIKKITESTLDEGKKSLKFSYLYFYDDMGRLVRIISKDLYGDKITTFVKYKFW